MDLVGRVALVTGGGTGVGNATSLLLASKGCDVVVNYSRSIAEAEATVAKVRELGRNSLAVQTDVSDESSVDAMFRSIDKEFGRLDVLFNNAGSGAPPINLEDLTFELFIS